MPICVHCNLAGLVPEEYLDFLRGLVLSAEQRREGMTKVVKSEASQPCFL